MTANAFIKDIRNILNAGIDTLAATLVDIWVLEQTVRAILIIVYLNKL